ncbi:MAG: 2,3,4,5-tetrahydropyridine-2,6-dicarboxylate N-succinyltransferase [Pseudobdellovibrionaceae bacterium]
MTNLIRGNKDLSEYDALKTGIEFIEKSITTGRSLNDLSPTELKPVSEIIGFLDTGKLRVCQQIDPGSSNSKSVWMTESWIKSAILLYFRMQKMELIEVGPFHFVDKIPLKKWNGKEGVRVVPHALARYGSYLESGTIMMPSYVNIGAYVGSGTMVDTWATVGSCAQIGKNVHLSGGVGIGGVLEPIQAQPVIVEDDCFLGSRAIVVEGVHLSKGVVLGAGVTLTASTKIVDVTKSTPTIYQGFVPANCVVIPGTLPKKYPAGEYGVPCALIIGQRKESTDKKTSLTEALRDFGVAI